MAAMPRKETRPTIRPAHASDEMERRGQPLIELSEDLTLTETAGKVRDRAILEEARQLVELQARTQKITSMLLEGIGLQMLLNALEVMFDNPVAIFREHHKPWLSEAGLTDASGEIEALLISFVPTSGIVGKGLGSGAMVQQNGSRAYVCPIPGRFAAEGATLVLLERNREIQPIDQLSLERFSPLVGLEWMNSEAIHEVEGKYLEQFLQDWLSGKMVSASDWKLRAEVCGCALQMNIPICTVLIGFPDEGMTTERLRDLARKVRAEQRLTGEAALAAPLGHELALIIPILSGVEETSDPSADMDLSVYLAPLLTELRLLLGVSSLRFFAGRTVTRPEWLPSSLSQARRARQVAEVCGLAGEIVTYDRLGVYSLLYLIPSSEEREQFLRRFALPLQQADRKGGGRLVETLEMFFRCNGNIKLTSEKLYAHYNTVVYRLDKIQHILGVSLDDPEDRLQLQLSLKLGQITPNGL